MTKAKINNVTWRGLGAPDSIGETASCKWMAEHGPFYTAVNSLANERFRITLVRIGGKAKASGPPGCGAWHLPGLAQR